MLFPPRCGGCGQEGVRWCAQCQKEVKTPRPPLCVRCGTFSYDEICPACREHPPTFVYLRSWSLFTEPVRPALHRLKYRRDMGLGEALAVPFARFVRSLQWPVDVVIPIPLSAKRYRERGYNQVALFAYPLALHLNLPYLARALKRTRETRSQVGLSAKERRENVQGAFMAEGKWLKGKTVLLVDDVATTGSTLSSAAQALLSAGANAVYAVTLARAIHPSLGGTYDA